MQYSTSFRPQQIDPTAFIAPGAIVLGDVTLAANASIWFNAVVRGDSESIAIGPNSNVQDCCVLHADPGFPCRIGSGVTVGHGAVVHGAILENDVLIGMKAVVMNGAKIGAGSIVASGTVVAEETQIPPGSVVMGLPGKIKRQTNENDLAMIRAAAGNYAERAKQFCA